VAGVLVLLYALKSGEAVSRLWIGYWWLAGIVGSIALRAGVALAVAAAQQAGHLRRAIVLIGDEEARERLARELRTAGGAGIRLVAGLPFPVVGEGHGGVHPLLRHPELAATLRADHVDEVVVVTDGVPASAVDALVRWLRTFPVAASLVAEGVGGRTPILALTRIAETQVLRVIEQPLDGWKRVVKALEDRILGGLFLILALPLMLVIAVAVKLGSPGPVLYRQLRHGFNQEPIEVLKFRTMYVDRCDAPDAAVVRQATRDDPRVTPVGRFLRRTSLDELPQLINVVRGEMSLVGPRPHALAHNDAYAAVIDGYLARHRVKPGITGWAQVNGCRGETASLGDMERRIRFDLEYVERWSLLADLAILGRTALQLIDGRNAW
jgi:putative colanic acid biosynthesis UDP-glucose lipid carrier transferase